MNGSPDDIYWMQHAMCLAMRAAEEGEVPVGAVIVKQGQWLAEGYNQPIGQCDPTAHAEINALRAAARVLANYRLSDVTLYVTLEPCQMCAAALVQARVARVVFGAPDPKTGACGSVVNVFAGPGVNHRPQVCGGVAAAACGELLTTFFQQRRGHKAL